VASIQEAIAFVDDVGMCTFHGDRGGLPTFYGAIAGREGPTPSWGQSDRDYDRAWSWKDKLFSQGKAYYGKPLGDFRMLISRELLPYVSAACAPGPVGSDDDYLGLYQGPVRRAARDRPGLDDQAAQGRQDGVPQVRQGARRPAARLLDRARRDRS
jgi:hypothetical protein